MSYEIDRQTSDTINIVKVFAIIFVCYIHSYHESINFAGNTIQLDIPIWFDIFQYSISKIISHIAVPLFFFLSSLLIYRKTIIWKENINRKINTLLIPYIILNTIEIILFFFIQQIPSLSILFSKPEFLVNNWNCFDWINAYIGYRNGCPLLFTLWFTRNLLLLNLLCTPIKFLVKKFHIALLILLYIIYMFFNYISNNLLLAQCIGSLFYWTLGCYFSINNIKFEDIKNFVEKYYLLLIYIVGCITCYMLHYTNQMFLPIEKVVVTIGVFCFIACAYKIRNVNFKNIVLKLSPYVFPIYLFHEFALTFFRKILALILPNTLYYTVLEYIMCPLIIIVYCIVLSVIIKKISPKLYSVITGGRV